MGHLPPIDGAVHHRLTDPIPPALFDHRFGGTAVLPAAEAIQLLARTVAAHGPDFSVDDIREVRLLKFLAISPEAPRLDAIARIEPLSDGRVRADLITRTTARASGIVRVKEHVSLIFGPTPPPEDRTLPSPSGLGVPRPDGLTLSGQAIYETLVPFGPAFHTIRTLRLDSGGAVAELIAPNLETFPGPLGSPFVVDGAFHSACVWGQRYAGVVAFSRGHRPTAGAPAHGSRSTVSGRSHPNWRGCGDFNLRDGDPRRGREALRGGYGASDAGCLGREMAAGGVDTRMNRGFSSIRWDGRGRWPSPRSRP